MRRTFKTVFYLRGNYVNKEGKSPIVLRITLDNERLTIGTTGITITPSLWDVKKQQLKGKSTEALQVNKKLDNIREELNAISEKLMYDGDLTLEKVKAHYERTEGDVRTIRNLFDRYIESVKAQVGRNLSDTTYSKYSLCAKRFMSMLKDRFHMSDMPLKDLKPYVIQDFHVYLMTEVGQCNNTATKTMKTLRTVILYGLKMGVLNVDPFMGVHLHMDPVDRGFLTEEELERIVKKKLDTKRLELVRDVFVFCCFTGLAYIDVRELRPEHFVTLNHVEWIKSNRIKTGTPINVVLFEGAKNIMKKYENDPRRKGRIFPMLTNQKMNQYLKEIAAVCGIDKDVTFHMARHTFATLTLSKGVPIESVSRMLGHTNIKTTQLYAKITNKKIEEDMAKFFENNEILNLGRDTIEMTGMKDEKNGKNEKDEDDEKRHKRGRRPGSRNSDAASTQP